MTPTDTLSPYTTVFTSALAPHGLDQHAELQFAAPCHFEGVALGGLRDMDGHVALGLAQQPRADHPALHLVAVAPCEGRVVDREGHRQGRRSEEHTSELQCLILNSYAVFFLTQTKK